MLDTETRTLHKPGVGTRPMQPKLSLAKYRVMVEDNARETGNDPEYSAPAVLWIAGPDTLIVFPCVMHEDPIAQLRAIAYGTAHEELPPPEWVCYLSEGFSTTTNKDNRGELDRLEKGELHDRHMIGMSGVGEAIVGHMAHRDGRTWLAAQTYTRAPAYGTLTWDEPHILDDQLGEGNVPHLLAIMVGRRPWEGP